MTTGVAGGLAGDIVLVYLIGLCPALALTRRFDAAVGLGAVTLMIAPPAAFLGYWVANMQSHTIVALPLLVMVVFVATYSCARILEGYLPQAYGLLAATMPMMAVNCTLLGIVLLSVYAGGGAVAVGLRALSLSCGYALALAVFAQLRERLASSDIPQPFRDAPVALITLGIVALALFGFTGMRTL